MWGPTGTEIEMWVAFAYKFQQICTYTYTPDDGPSYPKFVVWFVKNIVVLTDHLLV